MEVNRSILHVASRLSQARPGSASESAFSWRGGGWFCPPTYASQRLCSVRRHYREYLVSLINAHSLDPALLYNIQELIRACERYQVDMQRGENDEDNAYHGRLLKVRRF